MSPHSHIQNGRDLDFPLIALPLTLVRLPGQGPNFSLIAIHLTWIAYLRPTLLTRISL